MKKLIHSVGSVKPPMASSAKVHSAAGSGSRPVPSKHKIPVSAPKHAHKLDSRSANVERLK